MKAKKTAPRKPAAVASPSLPELAQKLEDQLVAAGPKAIRAATRRSKSPTWCIAIVFDSSLPTSWLPPTLAVVTLGERDITLRKDARQGRRYVWSCLQYDGVGAAWYSGRALLRACAELTEELVRRKDPKRASRLLVDVARRLNFVPRKTFGNVTEDFVVYAFDANKPATALVKRCLTRAQRAGFRKTGLL